MGTGTRKTSWGCKDDNFEIGRLYERFCVSRPCSFEHCIIYTDWPDPVLVATCLPQSQWASLFKYSKSKEDLCHLRGHNTIEGSSEPVIRMTYRLVHHYDAMRNVLLILKDNPAVWGYLSSTFTTSLMMVLAPSAPICGGMFSRHWGYQHTNLRVVVWTFA